MKSTATAQKATATNAVEGMDPIPSFRVIVLTRSVYRTCKEARKYSPYTGKKAATPGGGPW